MRNAAQKTVGSHTIPTVSCGRWSNSSGRFGRVFALAVTTALMACGAADIVQPKRAVAPPARMISCTGSDCESGGTPVSCSGIGCPSNGRLTVSIFGKVWAKVPGTFSYNASVSGGTAAHYHYVWTESKCSDGDEDCSTHYMATIYEGDDIPTVNFTISADETEDYMVVQVSEIGGTGLTGAANWDVVGPSTGSSGGSLAGGACDLYDDGYPFSAPLKDPYTDAVATVPYRWNTCNGIFTLEWKPGIYPAS
jgi:hypothetical protein